MSGGKRRDLGLSPTLSYWVDHFTWLVLDFLPTFFWHRLTPNTKFVIKGLTTLSLVAIGVSLPSILALAHFGRNAGLAAGWATVSLLAWRFFDTDTDYPQSVINKMGNWVFEKFDPNKPSDD